MGLEIERVISINSPLHVENPGSRRAASPFVWPCHFAFPPHVPGICNSPFAHGWTQRCLRLTSSTRQLSLAQASIQNQRESPSPMAPPDFVPSTPESNQIDIRAHTLDSVMYRTGLLAALRSKAKGGQIIGVMITASHNPAEV